MFSTRWGLVLSALGILFGFGAWLRAEPWLATRYAQNCAGCHAPGRLNKEPIGRRCSLSCQGCHVSPQGGGMRNQYGVWNQQRWLRSFSSPIFRDKGTPAPLDKQPYAQKVKEVGDKWRGGHPNGTPGAKGRPEIPAFNITSNLEPDNSHYDKKSYSEWLINVGSERDFLSTIPKGDPYRLEREEAVYAGGDLRYIYAKQDGDTISQNKKELHFLMAADLGARIRPLKYHELSFVLESRFLNGTSGTDLEDGFTSGARVKSAYILVDDLWYNSYLQAGLYRPMFGHYNADHTSLAQDVTGLGQRAVYKGLSVGTAPNVPFFVFNLIQPILNNDSSYPKDEGYVMSAGARFVTLGASIMGSYWQTKGPSGTNTLKKDMYSITGGATYGRLIGNFEFLRAQQRLAGAKDAGNVYTFEMKFRLWRENYLMANYAAANVDRSLAEGSANEYMLGFKSFLVAGTELELLYIDRKNDSNNITTNDHSYQLQAHLFF